MMVQLSESLGRGVPAAPAEATCPGDDGSSALKCLAAASAELRIDDSAGGWASSTRAAPRMMKLSDLGPREGAPDAVGSMQRNRW
jgi:hypothetical protein